MERALTIYSTFLTWRYEDDPSESPFQIVVKREYKYNEVTDFSIYLSEEAMILHIASEQLNYFLKDLLWHHQPSEVIDHLNYHYDHYKLREPGRELDFLSFIHKNIGEIVTKSKEKENDPDDFLKEWLFEDFRKNLFFDWIEKQVAGLSNEKMQQTHTKTKKRPLPILNEGNKPELTQVQISILFRIMKDKRIFVNRDLDKTQYAKILNELTGYSENTIRQNLSAKQLIEISDRPADYEKIIDMLQSVINELKKEMPK